MFREFELESALDTGFYVDLGPGSRTTVRRHADLAVLLHQSLPQLRLVQVAGLHVITDVITGQPAGVPRPDA